MAPLYSKLRQAEAIVIATPVYWFTVSAQTKLFMDRWYAMGGDEGYPFKGKKFGIILTYADEDPFRSGAVNALRTFQDALGFVERGNHRAWFMEAPGKPGKSRRIRPC